ncbi:mechanosensitive ion channel [Ramlibacter sp. USB13]|uniref:Small-conductance mechanosensitive channel n=1 Tax=Ramlibacter cellulosilyticus TaxID=2764187 RepID=A0A923MQW4_9BURK|nr:mechanosensitive ion channel family protein [Ramlibacter cellulosilyticus]MBC5783306.1 mechanosensitive ion channel [Ramlibacter cellulosilyticus]
MRSLLAVLLFLLARAALAADAAPPQEAVLSVWNRTVAVFRSDFLGVPPADRARRAQRAIEETLAGGGPGEVGVQQVPQGRVVSIDGSMVLVLTPQDVDVLRGESLDQATRGTVAALTRVIAETREARDRGRLLRAAGYALVATALYALAIWGVVRVRSAMTARAAAWVESAAQRSAGARMSLLQGPRVQLALRWLLRAASWVLLLALTYNWLVYVLQQFPRTRAAGEQLGSFVLGIGEQIGGGVVHALPDLAVAGVIFLLARGAVGLLKPVFDRAEQGTGQFGWLDRDLARPTRRLVNLSLWLFAIVMAYPYLPGSQTEAFKGVSVLVGLMVTLGGSSLFGQAASGMILMYTRTMRIGEYVRVGTTEGTVVGLGTFTTRIRTGLGDEVTLPNALVMGSVISNYSRAAQGAGYMVETGVTIGYDTAWREVEAMLLEAARRTPGVLAQPAARVLQRALGDFYVDYRLVCQAMPENPRERAEVLHTLHANVLDVFNERGVQIMSPHYMVDPAEPKIVPPTHAAGRPRPAVHGSSERSIATRPAGS